MNIIATEQLWRGISVTNASEQSINEMPIMALNPLSIPRHALGKAGISRYRIYLSDGKTELVEAGSAAEAVTKASSDDVVKAVRETRYVMRVVEEEEIEKKEEAEYVETLVTHDENDDSKTLQSFLTIEMPEMTEGKKADQFVAMPLATLHNNEEAKAAENNTPSAADNMNETAPDEPVKAADTEAAKDEPKAADASATSPAPAEEVELSEDEVNKLLNGEE